MDSDLSELSASDINDTSSNASFGDSDESSRSSNFATRWPETHANTYQFIRDAELDTKKFQPIPRNTPRNNAPAVSPQRILRTVSFLIISYTPLHF